MFSRRAPTHSRSRVNITTPTISTSTTGSTPGIRVTLVRSDSTPERGRGKQGNISLEESRVPWGDWSCNLRTGAAFQGCLLATARPAHGPAQRPSQSPADLCLPSAPSGPPAPRLHLGCQFLTGRPGFFVACRILIHPVGVKGPGDHVVKAPKGPGLWSSGG